MTDQLSENKNQKLEKNYRLFGHPKYLNFKEIYK